MSGPPWGSLSAGYVVEALPAFGFYPLHRRGAPRFGCNLWPVAVTRRLFRLEPQRLYACRRLMPHCRSPESRPFPAAVRPVTLPSAIASVSFCTVSGLRTIHR
jgi:hypothetical protein